MSLLGRFLWVLTNWSAIPLLRQKRNTMIKDEEHILCKADQGWSRTFNLRVKERVQLHTQDETLQFTSNWYLKNQLYVE